MDTKTPNPFDEFPGLDAAKEGHVYMDAMGFGMGCCCIQVTFQVRTISFKLENLWWKKLSVALLLLLEYLGLPEASPQQGDYPVAQFRRY